MHACLLADINTELNDMQEMVVFRDIQGPFMRIFHDFPGLFEWLMVIKTQTFIHNY